MSTMVMKHSLMTCLLLALAMLGVLVVAAPLQDISKTSVDLAEAKGDNEHLLVTVTRVDDLVNDDGAVLAERVMAVQVSFDVVGNQIHCNGIPIELGVSNIQVEAQVVSDPSKLTIESEQELAVLEDSFDLGLATVEVTATLLDELISEEGVAFRRIAVQEKITEINHEKVLQTNVGQQLLDVFEDGRVDRWSVDPITGFLLPENNPDRQQQEQQRIEDDLLAPWMCNDSENGCGNLMDPIMQWWDTQSSMMRGILTGALCASLFAAALFVRHLLISVNSAYGALPLYDVDGDGKDGEDTAPPPFYEHADDANDDAGGGVDEKQPFLPS